MINVYKYLYIPFNKIIFCLYSSCNRHFTSPIFITYKMILMVFSTLWPNYSKLLMILTTIEIFSATMPALHIWLGKQTLDSILVYIESTSFPQFILVLKWVALQNFVLLVQYLLFISSSKIRIHLTELLDILINNIIQNKQISLDLSYFEHNRYHNLISLAVDGAQSNSLMALNETFQLFRQIISFISFFIILLHLHWIFCVIGLFTSFPSFWAGKKIADIEYHFDEGTQEIKRLSSVYQGLACGQIGIKELRLWDFGSFILNQWRQIKRDILYQHLSVLKASVSLQFGVQIVNTVSVFISTSLMIYYGTNYTENFSIGQAAMYIASFVALQQGWLISLQILNILYKHGLYYKDYEKFINLKPNIIYPKHSKYELEHFHSMKFCDISFKYPWTERFIIKNLSFEIYPKEVLIITGENGIGKSTLIKLMCRLYDPTCGHISLNNKDLKQYTKHDLKRHVSILFQDFEKYPLTVKENIVLGNIENTLDENRLEYIMEICGVNSLLNSYGIDYDTYLSRHFKSGIDLSGGQWKRIALARMLYSDANLLIFDELSAHLDKDYLGNVKHIIRNEVQKKAIIIITHDTTLHSLADRIVYICNNGTEMQFEENIDHKMKCQK